MDHIDETGMDPPAEPILFSKTPNVLTAPEEYIEIPAFLHDCGFDEVVVHYAAELALIIGKRAKNVSSNEAMNYVLGYICFNDVSQRNLQFTDASGWFRENHWIHSGRSALG